MPITKGRNLKGAFSGAGCDEVFAAGQNEKGGPEAVRGLLGRVATRGGLLLLAFGQFLGFDVGPSSWANGSRRKFFVHVFQTRRYVALNRLD